MSNKPALAPGQLFVISGPSGTGKTSLVAAALERDKQLQLSISYTTRQPRPGEIDGQHYHFVNVTQFEEKIHAGDLLEYAKVFDNFYGTSATAIQAQRNSGHDVILEIDWQGAQQIQKNSPHCQSIFILPPSLETLRQRLEARNTDSQALSLIHI